MLTRSLYLLSNHSNDSLIQSNVLVNVTFVTACHKNIDYVGKQAINNNNGSKKLLLLCIIRGIESFMLHFVLLHTAFNNITYHCFKI